VHGQSPGTEGSNQHGWAASTPILNRGVEFARDYQCAGTVNVDDDAFARDIVRVAAAMAGSMAENP
jgi:hypothetical protein